MAPKWLLLNSLSNGTSMEKQATHIIDAADKTLGRLAVQIAILLRGKQKADFLLHTDDGDFVVVKNVRKLKLTGNKLLAKKYYRHSGYFGGLHEQKVKAVIERNPAEVLRRAVLGMLPKNRLRAQQIKRLKMEE